MNPEQLMEKARAFMALDDDTDIETHARASRELIMAGKQVYDECDKVCVKCPINNGEEPCPAMDLYSMGKGFGLFGIPDVYFKKSNPYEAYNSFVLLLEAHPEISCDHPDHTDADEWTSMSKPEWEKWMATGERPEHIAIV